MINYKACEQYNQFILYAKSYWACSSENNDFAEDLITILDDYSCSEHSRTDMIRFVSEIFVDIFHSDNRIMGQVFYKTLYGLEMKDHPEIKFLEFMKPPSADDILARILAEFQNLRVLDDNHKPLFELGKMTPKLKYIFKEKYQC